MHATGEAGAIPPSVWPADRPQGPDGELRLLHRVVVTEHTAPLTEPHLAWVMTASVAHTLALCTFLAVAHHCGISPHLPYCVLQVRDFIADSGATIRVQSLSELTPSDPERTISISGARDQVLRAVALVLNTVSALGHC